MARKTRTIPQKTLSNEDRELFEHMIDQIKSQVGVFINNQPYNFIIDTRIFTNTTRFPVARPKVNGGAWGNYFAYTPSYSALNPEQRWNYIAWLNGQEQLGIQMFRIMRIHGLCCEFAGERRTEALAALRKLYTTSQNDSVSSNMIGNILTLGYAAIQPNQLKKWLQTFQPTSAIPIQLQAYIYARSSREAPGEVLLELALANSFKLARGMSSRREQIIESITTIAEAWQSRESCTFIEQLLANTTITPSLFGYNDTLIMWVCRTLDLAQGTLKLDDESTRLIHALATAGQEHVRSRKKGSEELDGLQLLDGILQGDSNVAQFDLSGTTPYRMNDREKTKLETTLSQLESAAWITLFSGWQDYEYWNQNQAYETALDSSLPIKQPTSEQPLETPSPLTFTTATYRNLTPEQRWWFLEWLNGESSATLPCFIMLRFKMLEVAIQDFKRNEWHAQADVWNQTEPDQRGDSIYSAIEELTAAIDNETLLRRAATLLLPIYGRFLAGEKATDLFERVSFTNDQGPEMLEHLWDAGGTLTGRGLLNIARAGGFNHTPLTRECFDQIAEQAMNLLQEWETTYGSITDLPITQMFGSYRNRRVKTVLSVTADIAREAQEIVKVERRKAPRSNRMSADELAAEREELAELPTNSGDELSERLYQQLANEPRLLDTYITQGVQALAETKPDRAVAFLRRAYDIDQTSAAHQLLPFARAKLAVWQHTQGEEQRS